MLVFGENDSRCLSDFFQTDTFWKLDLISRTYNQINYRELQGYLICKSNNNSYHDGSSAFFDLFFEKDPHLNAVECFHSFSKKTNLNQYKKVCENKYFCGVVMSS